MRHVYIGKPLDAGTVEAIRLEQCEHGVLLFRDAHLDDVSQENFTAHFGTVGLNLRSDVDHVSALGHVDLKGNFHDPTTDQANILRANQE